MNLPLGFRKGCRKEAHIRVSYIKIEKKGLFLLYKKKKYETENNNQR